MNRNKTSGALREDVYAYAFDKFNSSPEFLWKPFPNYAVFRREDNKKWYAVIMDLPKEKIGLKGKERVDILDIKCNPMTREILLEQKGFLPAYHLNRENWITVLLDGSVDKDLLFGLIDQSFEIAKGKSKKTLRYEPTSWLIPANPKYYDIQKAFADSDTILWKQSSSIIVGDTLYLYVAAPYSCIMYKCQALEVNIPYDYVDENVSMSKVMKIKRIHTYEKGKFGIEELQEHGVVSVRGPRGVPYGLKYKLEKAAEDNKSKLKQ